MKTTQIIAIVFLAVAIGVIISMVYSTDPYSNFAHAQKGAGREVQIIGEWIETKPIEEKIVNNTLMFTFYMTDSHGGQEKVTYFGPKPMDFEKLDNVVVIGKYVENTFVASRLLLKCPSKYQEQGPGQQTADNPQY